MPIDFTRVRLAFIALGLWLAALGTVAAESIPDEEAFRMPERARLESVQKEANERGWASPSADLRSAARRAFASDKLSVAAAWLRLYHWSSVLARKESEFIPTWIEAVKRANVVHGGMPTEYLLRTETLAGSFTPECLEWVLQNPTFSEQFFSLVQVVDYLPRVFELLSQLHLHDPAAFDTYANLALAIAVVYDVPPPPDWPHAQVSETLLKRAWLEPVAVFDWLIKQVRMGQTQHSLRRLQADELKFVVDIAVPLKELEWAQSAANLPLHQLERAYSMVLYQDSRLSKEKWVWAGEDYTLKTILATGGICVDQAFFANAVGKARGVPTLFFSGVGDNGRHAWFGYLGPNQQWHFNAGRYAEQQLVTGFARDPQTWRLISDHELTLLSERATSKPAFRDSHLLTQFAADFFATKDALASFRAARRAVNLHRRNRIAWEILLAAEIALGVSPKQREATIREAMLAFAHYPDLEVYYSNLMSESLRSRGETSAADFEQRRITQKFALERTDLGLRRTREAMWRISEVDPDAQLVRNYNTTLDRMGPGAGIAFFDEIVLPVIDHFAKKEKFAEAERVLERARRTLRIEPKSQLEHEFAAVAAQLKQMGR